VSMLEAMSHFALEPFAAFFALGDVPKSSDRPRLAQAYILRTADRKLIAIHLSSLEKFWTGLVTALGDAALNADPRFNKRQARIDNYETLGAELDRRFAERPLEHWSRVLGENDVPFAPINGIDQVIEDPQVKHLDLIVPAESPNGAGRSVRPAVQFGGKHAVRVKAAPLLDQDGRAIRLAIANGERWPSTTRPPVDVRATANS
jgi:crotonobetainyl-CoA:carnitine CoA-transferase CaiB-like acyl-CoA transferase